jgi:Zn-dependent protease
MMVFFIVIMLVNQVTSGAFSSPMDWLYRTFTLLPGILIGITVHEFAHAFSAYRLGDMTPKAQGRVTLNPARHMELLGLVTLVFVGFGWGKPVMINPNAFKHRRIDDIITSVAGVVTNFVVAFLFLFIIRWTVFTPYFTAAGGAGFGLTLAYDILINIVYMNIVLMVFNLLPIPPLDGFNILSEIFDLRRFDWYQWVMQYGGMILLLLIIFRVLSKVLGPMIQAVFGFMTGIVF